MATEDVSLILLDFRALLESAPDGIAVTDERGRIVVANEELGHLFGYESDELVGSGVEALVPKRLRHLHDGHRADYGLKPSTRAMGMGLDLLGLRKDGTEFPIEISLSPVRAGLQSFTIAVVRDSTERRRLQVEEQALRTFLDAEEERYRIGMDLHDGIMQDIYAVTLGLELAQDDIESDPRQAKASVGRSIDELHEVIRNIRSYIFDLRPRQLNGDLCLALQDLGREFEENSSILTHVDVPPENPAIDNAVGVALYVIAHEALSNTRKYAGAKSVTIRLGVNDGMECLEIRDDGKGFDTSVAHNETHRGLRNMASRAGAIGANFRIESVVGQGTAISVEIPST